MKTFLLSFTTALLLSSPALAITPEKNPELAASQSSAVTQFKTEKALFEQGLEQAREAVRQADYEAAEAFLHTAQHWMLAMTDSLMTERSPSTWDDLRQMELSLLQAYERLGRHYQRVGRYDRAVLAMQEGLLINPYYAPLRAQQQQAFVALLHF